MRPVAVLNNSGVNSSDVLAIKSSIANINSVSKKWSMIKVIGAIPQVTASGDSAMNFSVTTPRQWFTVVNGDGVLQSCNTWEANYYGDATTISGGLDSTKVYFIYGLDNNSGAHRMPFNRVDYYLERVAGEIPSSCAPSTYTLYRSVIKQADGTKIKKPLLDCVKDFQVAFGLDKAVPEGKVDTWTNNLTGLTSDDIRKRLLEVRVFILYHEGGGDVTSGTGFRFSGTLNLGDQDIAHSLDSANYPVPPNTFQTLSPAPLTGAPQLSRFTPAGNDAQYRWKVVELAVKPMNLRQ